MILSILGYGLVYFLFAVGLGAAVGEKAGQALGKNPRTFAGIGAGLGLLTLLTVGWISSQQEPEPPVVHSAPALSVLDSEAQVNDDGQAEESLASSDDAFAGDPVWAEAAPTEEEAEGEEDFADADDARQVEDQDGRRGLAASLSR